MFIRPALVDPSAGNEGARFTVRDPMTMQHLAAEGEDKPANDYWLRRLLEGGVEIFEAHTPTPTAAVEPLPSDGQPKLSDGERARAMMVQEAQERGEYAVAASDAPHLAEENRP